MWILTESHNDYDQHGDYYVQAWVDKPSATKLAKVFNRMGMSPSHDFLHYILKGGGRQEIENVWWQLFEDTE